MVLMFGPDNSHHLSASAKAKNRNVFCSEDPNLMQQIPAVIVTENIHNTCLLTVTLSGLVGT